MDNRFLGKYNLAHFLIYKIRFKERGSLELRDCQTLAMRKYIIVQAIILY